MSWVSVLKVSLVAGVVAGAVTVASLASVTGQTRGPAVPRLNGKPDLNGVWQAINTANWDIEPHAARPALAMRPGPVVPVPAKEVIAFGAVGSVPFGMGVVVGNEIPYTPEALAKKKENQENWLTRDPEIKCYLPGVPRATYMPFPFQIFQSDSKFFIAYEYAGAVRDVHLTDPGPPEVDSWMGQSVGRWDGDTFVIEVTGFNGQAWFDRSGNHASERLKVTERYTMVDANHIQYEATVEDPQTFTRPWMMRMPLYRRLEAGARLGQFKCVEFVTELMYGHLRKEPIK
ncbi:MAG: hypothetical protein AB1635_12730 [Acidobacteriota bacterium]